MISWAKNHLDMILCLLRINVKNHWEKEVAVIKDGACKAKSGVIESIV